jgi:hypothetical protein
MAGSYLFESLRRLMEWEFLHKMGAFLNGGRFAKIKINGAGPNAKLVC